MIRQMFYVVALLLALPVAGHATQQEWYSTEPKSKIDDSVGFFATLASMDEKSELSLRCREGKTDIFIRLLGRYTSFNSDGVKVIYRIDDKKAVRAKWIASTGNEAVFVTVPIKFIKSLPNNGRLVVRIEDFRGAQSEYEYDLHRMDEMRTQLAAHCGWK